MAGRQTALWAIEFERIRAGKPFDISVDWFGTLLAEIGQPLPRLSTP
jgi:diphosphate-dependent phosphofructokinase